MRRRPEYLICKRDGSRQWLRAAKLARSIAAAIEIAEGPDDVGDSARITTAVIAALRRRAEMTSAVRRVGATTADCFCSTAELSAAAERALWVSGHPRAATCYAEQRAERALRRCSMLDHRAERCIPDLRAGVRARVTFDHN